MASDVLERTIGQVHAWAAARETAALPDRELLRQFVATRHEPAFAALVHRHGPLVFGVCRRMLGDRHDAEDALQATFLILACKAASVRNTESLASWLHGTAVRVALNLRRRRQRRLEHEAAAARPDRVFAADEVTWREVQAALDEELGRLPEHYRAPLVLCHLEGKSRDEAAALLGWSAGTLHGRLERAKRTLHTRLTARGLTLSACLAATALPAQRVAAATVVALSRAAATGNTSLLPATVVQLAEAAGRAGSVSLVKLGAGFAAGLVAATLAVFSAAQTPPPEAKGTPVAAGRGKKAPPIFLAAVLKEDELKGRIIAVDPDTGAWRQVVDADTRNPRLSPDSETVIFLRDDGVWNCDAAGSNNPGKLFDFVPYAGFSFTPDGRHLIGSKIASMLGNEIWRHETWRHDADGRNPEKLNIPAADAVLDISPDGQWALTRSRLVTRLNTSDLKLVRLDGSESRRLSDLGGFNEPGRFSHDGTRVAWCRRVKGVDSVWVVNIDGTGKKRVFEAKDVHTQSVCWSPDGKRLAMVLMDYGASPDGLVNRFQFGPDGNWRIELIDVDSGEHRTVPLKGNVWSLRDVDWRQPVRVRQNVIKQDAKRRGEPDSDKPRRDAIRKAVEFLKSKQQDGHWEPASEAHRPGHTALALWALLEAGLPTDDVAVAKALTFVRGVESKSTYGVSLQTAALCRAGMPEDRERIKRNVKWLSEAMVRDGQGQCRGWTYQYVADASRSDNSNAQYAVMGLHAAAEIGIEVDAAVWRQLKDYYLRTQQPDGGWAYAGVAGSQTTFTMTCGGVSGVAIACRHLKEKPPAEALLSAQERLAQLYEAKDETFAFYKLHSLSRAGALANISKLVNKTTGAAHDWRKDVSARLLGSQTVEGRWDGLSQAEPDPVVTTSFAILSLSSLSAKSTAKSAK
jgi:RNA polymerase sigma factor (sigma-70 family)